MSRQATLPVAPVAPVERAASIEARGITKRYGTLAANDDVDFSAFPGEVHALLGENGAGKSTLVKILYGYTRPDDGEILVEGHKEDLRSPADARSLGIGMVFQQPTLIPAFTVAENVALVLPHLPAVISLDDIAERVREVSNRYGLSVDPGRRAGHLSVGEQQRVEVVKLLIAEARVLIFDEPTSLLTPREIESLLEVFDRLRKDGFPVIFITHKLGEVMTVADRITVMRHGQVTGTVMRTETSETSLVGMMFGDQPERPPRTSKPPIRGPTLVDLQDATTFPTDGVPLSDVTFSVGPGEIVGVAGVAGNGQRELANLIMGIQRLKSGTKQLFGEPAQQWSVGKTRSMGVGYLPENPLGTALIAGMTVQQNMALSEPHRFSAHHGFSIDWAGVDDATDAAFEQLGLDPLSASTVVGGLSGGNAQRLAVVRELALHPHLLIAAYPTKGLDVPTVHGVQRLLLTARDGGAGILLFSHDIQELITVSDRLLVLCGGRIVAEIDPQDADVYEIGLLMTGGEVDDGNRSGAGS